MAWQRKELLSDPKIICGAVEEESRRRVGLCSYQGTPGRHLGFNIRSDSHSPPPVPQSQIILFLLLFYVICASVGEGIDWESEDVEEAATKLQVMKPFTNSPLHLI